MAKGGKYGAVIGNLPKLSIVEPGRLDVVESVKLKILEQTDPPEGSALSLLDTANTLMIAINQHQLHGAAGKPCATEFARMYAELRKVKAQIQEWESNTNLILEAYQLLMLDAFEQEGISGLTLDNGQKLVTFSEPFAQVVDKVKFRQWCLDHDFADAMTLPWQTINMITKELLLEGQPEPDGVTCWSRPTVRLGKE